MQSRRHAWRHQELGVSRATVICDVQAGSIVGCVGLSTAQIERAWWPKSRLRNRPDPMPAILLGQLAVALRWQRQGLARSLMSYALATAVRLSGHVGCLCVTPLWRAGAIATDAGSHQTERSGWSRDIPRGRGKWVDGG
jgi:predicted N-acetyltransferase YhbS